jgi:dipeptidyl-peptidase 4
MAPETSQKDRSHAAVRQPAWGDSSGVDFPVPAWNLDIVFRSVTLKRALVTVLFLVSICPPLTFSQSSAESPKKPLTIEAIFAEGGLTGRPPEAVQWSPDGKMLTFVQRDDAGEHGQLWYVDAATGEKKVLVSEAKLAGLAPDATKIKDEREKERVLRYHVAAYVWSPDSKDLLFDSQGQLWMYSLENGVAVQFTSSSDVS